MRRRITFCHIYSYFFLRACVRGCTRAVEDFSECDNVSEELFVTVFLVLVLLFEEDDVLLDDLGPGCCGSAAAVSGNGSVPVRSDAAALPVASGMAIAGWVGSSSSFRVISAAVTLGFVSVVVATRSDCFSMAGIAFAVFSSSMVTSSIVSSTGTGTGRGVVGGITGGRSWGVWMVSSRGICSMTGGERDGRRLADARTLGTTRSEERRVG